MSGWTAWAWRGLWRGSCVLLLALGLSGLAQADDEAAPSAAGEASSQGEAAETRDPLTQDLPTTLAQQDKLVSTEGLRAAQSFFRDLKAANPDNELARFLYARLTRGSGGRGAMRSALKKRLGLGTDRAADIGAGWGALARRQIDENEYEDALTSARHAATLTQSASAHALVGWLADRAGDKQLAYASYALALRVDPRYEQARSGILPLLLARGETEEALRHCRGTLLLQPRSALAHLQLGMALSADGKIEEARQAYETAIGFAAGDPARVSSIAMALRQIEHAALAEKSLRSALESAPDDYGLLVNLAVIHIDREDYAGAIPLLERARKLRPKLATTWYLLGISQVRSGEVRDAIRSLQRAVRLAPRNLSYQLALGSVHRSDDDLKDAVRVFKKAVRAFPDDVQAATAYARALFDSKKYKNAAVAYEKVIALDPSGAEPRFLLAIAYGAHLGKLERAYELLLDYERAGGAEPGALEWLARLRERFE